MKLSQEVRQAVNALAKEVAPDISKRLLSIAEDMKVHEDGDAYTADHIILTCFSDRLEYELVFGLTVSERHSRSRFDISLKGEQ